MTDPEPHSPEAADNLPSFAGSRITYLSLTGQGDIVSGRNTPGSFSPGQFAALLMKCRVSSISGRTVGTMVSHVAKTGESARAQCTLSENQFVGNWDLELWQQEGGGVGMLLIDATGRDGDTGCLRSLSLELAHRTKNVMAIVLSLANQTSQRMPDYERFKTHFFGQVEALSKAHDIVAATGWQGAAIGTIIETYADAEHENTAIEVAADVSATILKPNAVQNIAIVLRELQAACKISEQVLCEVGAIDNGGLELIWSCGGNYSRDDLWTNMLCRYAPTSFDGYGEIDFDENGFRYRLVIGNSQTV